jgi:hypothetical protein
MTVVQQYEQELTTPATFSDGSLAPLDDSRVMTYAAQFYPAARSADSAVTVAVGAAREVTGIDLHVSPVPTVRLSGVLIGPDGPTPLLPVRLVATGSEVLGPIADTAKTISDPDGGFTFEAVSAGEYSIQVLQAPETLWANVSVTVGDEDIPGLEIVLKRGLSMAGRIVFDGTSAKPEGLQQSRLPVFLEPVDGPGSTDTAIIGRADARGEFVLPRVAGGRYRLRVPTPIGPWVLAGVQMSGRDIADLPMELGDSDVSDLVVTYTDRPSSISGTIQMSGRPRDDACVIVFPAESELRARAGRNSRRFRISELSESGVYRISDLPRGGYYVAAIQAFTDDWRDPAFLERLTGSARYVRVGDGEQVTADLRLRDLDR